MIVVGAVDHRRRGLLGEADDQPGHWTSPYGDTIKFNYYWSRCNPDNTGCEYLHTGKTHTVGFGRHRPHHAVMVSVETDHGVAIRYATTVMHEAPPVNSRRAVDRRRRHLLGEADGQPGRLDEPLRRHDQVQLLLEPLQPRQHRLRVPAHRQDPQRRPRRPRPHHAVMISVETDHGGAIRYAFSPVMHESPPVMRRAVDRRRSRSIGEADREPGRLVERVRRHGQVQLLLEPLQPRQHRLCTCTPARPTPWARRHRPHHAVMISVETDHGVRSATLQPGHARGPARQRAAPSHQRPPRQARS